MKTTARIYLADSKYTHPPGVGYLSWTLIAGVSGSVSISTTVGMRREEKKGEE